MPEDSKFSKWKTVTKAKIYCAQEMIPSLERNENVWVARL